MTPETLRAAYDFLRVTKPFNRWGLPPGDALKFAVTHSPHYYGDYSARGILRVSARMNGHTVSILETLAHEMIHVFQHANGRPMTHARWFNALAAQVCKHHGFDPKRF